jgi:hypothetical protein
MRLSRLIAIAVAAAAAVCACAGAAPPGGRVVALSANPAASSNPISGLLLATRAGARGTFASYTWSTLEPARGKYALGDLAGLRDVGQSLHLRVLLGIQVLNTTVNEVPRDLRARAFDAPETKRRFRRLLVAIRPYLNRNVEYLSIGNEVDVYLSAHPDAWTAYARFYRYAAAQAHALAPWLKVGATTTFDGGARYSRQVKRLNAPSDVEIVTYYPLGERFTVRPPDSPLTDFRALLRLAGGRPLVLQEVGYPSARRLNSSPAKQAAFVRAVYRAWANAGGRIPFLNFFLLHDLTRASCEQLGSYYGLRDENFLAYLCSLGLRRANGVPKPAWRAFVDGAARIARAAEP